MCGIAGTFTVLDDLAVFLRYLLNPTTAPQRPASAPEWSAYSLTVQTGDLQPERGLFWHPALGTTHGHRHVGLPRPGQVADLLTNKLHYTRARQPLTVIRNKFRGLAFCKGAKPPLAVSR